MTDVRDRSPESAAAGADEPAIVASERSRTLVPLVSPATPATRASLAARLLSPMRRRTARDVVARSGAMREVVDTRAAGQRATRRAVALSLILVVLLPVLATGGYLFLVASDQYVAEMRFVVRKADAPRNADGVASSGGGSGGASVKSSSLLSGGANLSAEDAEIVANYIHSRAAIEEIARSVDVETIYQRPEADFWARLRNRPKIEELVKYWKRMTSVYVEPTSGIVSVSVTAFRREDALTLAKAILAMSDRLANSLTVKMRADQTRLAEDEVRRAEGSVRFALADLTAFRNAQHVVDPVESSKSTGKLMMELIGDRIQTEGQLYVMQRAQGANAPGMAGVKARLQSINQHIDELQNQLAGSREAAGNMAATLAQFEELEVKKEFAEKLFGFAAEGLERAQLNAMSTSIYLAVFMPPSLPQDYSYPNRFTDLLLIAMTAMMTWVSGATITASILDHRL